MSMDFPGFFLLLEVGGHGPPYLLVNYMSQCSAMCVLVQCTVFHSALYCVSQCNALCDSVQCTACPSAIHCMSQCSALCPCAVHFVSQCNVCLLTAVLPLVCAQKWNILISPVWMVLFGHFSAQRAVTHSQHTPVIVTMTMTQISK